MKYVQEYLLISKEEFERMQQTIKGVETEDKSVMTDFYDQTYEEEEEEEKKGSSLTGLTKHKFLPPGEPVQKNKKRKTSIPKVENRKKQNSGFKNYIPF